MERPGRVFSRAQLLDLVWGHGVYVEERTVDVHMSRLRKAINKPFKMVSRLPTDPHCTGKWLCAPRADRCS